MGAAKWEPWWIYESLPNSHHFTLNVTPDGGARQCNSGDAGAAGRSRTTSHVATFFFAGAAPDATVLIGGECELETFLTYTAVGAHCARSHEHARCFTGVADGEEHVGVDVSAVGVHSPGVISGTKGEALSEDGHAGVRLSGERAERKGQIRYPDAWGRLSAHHTRAPRTCAQPPK